MTKLSQWAERLAESGWLIALMAVPIFFNPFTERIFEEDKVPLMRSIALVVLLALLIWIVEQGRDSLQVAERSFWRLPLLLPALLLAALYLISTAFSVQPSVSLLGDYIRRQGSLTWLSYLAFFVAILLLVRRDSQVKRLLTVVIWTSVPACLYGIMQNQGIDPIPWGGDVVERVSSTAGNPIFLSAYLIMVVPLTLMRLLEAGRRWRQGHRVGPPDGVALLRVPTYGLILLLQSVAILFSQSRGPLIGLGVGLVCFGILYALPLSRKVTLSLIGLTGVAMAFLLLFNLPNSPLAPLREVRYIGRLGSVLETSSGTGLARTLIWEGATDLIASDPARALIGYGPETIASVYPPFYPPALGQVESRKAAPDRTHNESYDAIITIGLLGFVAQSALFLLIIFYTLRWLGLVPARRHALTYAAAVALGGVLGALLPRLLEGTWRMAGVGLPAGIAVGLIGYLLIVAFTLPRDDLGRHPNGPLLIALLAAVIGHFVEIHFGIAIAATRLHFWAFTALIVVLGMGLAAPDDGAATPTPRPTTRRRRNDAASPWLTPLPVAMGLLMGLLLIILTYIFYLPNMGLAFDEVAAKLFWLMGGSWLFGALLVATDANDGGWGQRLLQFALASITPWLLFSLIYAPWANAGGGAMVPQTRHFANSITFLYITVFVLMGLVAWALQRGGTSHTGWLRGPRWQGALYGVAAIALFPLILGNLNISRADAFNRYGDAYEKAAEWANATTMYQTAIGYGGAIDSYQLSLGRTLLENARGPMATNPGERDRLLQQADETLRAARQQSRLNPDHPRNLAALHRAWANLIQAEDGAAATSHREQAKAFYEEALDLSPYYAYLWNEYATLLADMDQFDEAEAALDHSRTLDDQFIETYLYQAQIARLQEKPSEALAYYDEALTVDPDNRQVQTGKVILYAEMGDLDQAITISEGLLAENGNDYNTLTNLALLYRDNGQLQEARQMAERALLVAPEADRPALQQLIDRLTGSE
ncbi:MAG: tetratricopeptide repeat protein [Ardenticatenales bacterium]|nr:tetratricopeptide repeat protein [Ardenticatenales bacterium]MCB9172024.1 tetratricopeptide repeat protein [Ardenticatenales bacterium]